MPMAINAKCPSCYNKVTFGYRPHVHQRITCPICNTALEVMRINPPLLDWFYESDRDYDIDGDYLSDEISFEKRW
jgi:hypothetical protein